MTHIKQPITETPFIFLDIETTGLLVERGHRICELALTRGGQEDEDDLVWLLNPTRPVSMRSYELHGINDALVDKAPVFGDIVETLLSTLTAHVVVGHNLWFDLKFIAKELNLLQRHLPPLWCIDTLSLTKKYEQQCTNYTLSTLSFELLGETPQGLHQAQQDAHLCAKLFIKLVERHQLQTLAQCGIRRWSYTL